jgi:hypothetical protein
MDVSSRPVLPSKSTFDPCSRLSLDPASGRGIKRCVICKLGRAKVAVSIIFCKRKDSPIRAHKRDGGCRVAEVTRTKACMERVA